MKKCILVGFAFTIGLATTGHSAPVVMEGDYVKTAVSDDGTLGYGGTTSPGLLHDTTGTGNFTVDDYLTPGSPWEIFSVKSDQTGLLTNNNASGDAMSGTLSDLSTTSSYDHHVSWTSNYMEFFQITTETFFNDGDERVNFSTMITALVNLENIEFLRAIDPDPDVATYHSYNTVNDRGYDSNGDGDYYDTGDVAPEDWVHSEGTSTGLTLGLYSDSAYTHNTGVTYPWSSDPATYLLGTNAGDGDYAIGMAFSIGSLSVGDSATLDYAYIMGGDLASATSGTTTDPVPEPATMLLFGTGIASLVGYRRKQKK